MPALSHRSDSLNAFQSKSLTYTQRQSDFFFAAMFLVDVPIQSLDITVCEGHDSILLNPYLSIRSIILFSSSTLYNVNNGISVTK